MSLRIVFYDDRHATYYGGQKGMILLAKGLKARGLDPVVVLGGEGRYAEEVRLAGLPLHIEPMPSSLRVYGKSFLNFRLVQAALFYLRYAQFALRLARRVKALGPDLLYANNIRSVVVLTPARLFCGKRLVWYVRSGGDASTAKLAPLWRVGIRLVDQVVLIAEANRSVFSSEDQARFAGKITVNHSGIAVPAPAPSGSPDVLRARFGLPVGPVLFTCVASIAWRKGQDILLEAMRGLVLQQPDVHLCIVGDAGDDAARAYEAGLRAFTAAHQLPVSFIGWTDQVMDVLAASDVYVLPSRNEGMSRSILEAMAAGLPVVSTDIGGASEQIAEGVTGYVVPGEDAAAMAAVMGRLAADPELRGRMGGGALERVTRHFSLDSYIDGFRRIAEQLAHRPPA